MIRHTTVSDLRATRCPRVLSGNLPVATISQLANIRTQKRNFWKYSHRYNGRDSEWERHRAEKYRRLCLARMRRAAQQGHRPSVMPNQQHWWGQGWGWGGFNSGFPGLHGSQGGFGETERARTSARIEQIKKAIEADPYAALFGKRLEPFNFLNKADNTFASLWRSLFQDDRSADAKTTDTTARPKMTPNKYDNVRESSNSSVKDTMNERSNMQSADTTSKSAPETTTSININQMSRDSSEPLANKEVSTESPPQAVDNVFEFDPISGRMVLKKPTATDDSKECTHVGDSDPSNVSMDHGPSLARASVDDNRGFLSSVQEADHAPELQDFREAKENQGGELARKSTEPEERTVMQHDDSLTNAAMPHEGPQQDTSQRYSQEVPGSTMADNSQSSKTASSPWQVAGTDQQAGNVLNPWREIEYRDAEDNEKPFGSRGSIENPDGLPANFKIEDSHEHFEPILKETENLDSLRASDIRASYESKYPNHDSEPQNKLLDLEEVVHRRVESVPESDARALGQNIEQNETSEPADKPGTDKTYSGEVSGSVKAADPEVSQSIHSQQPSSMEQTSSESAQTPETFRVLAYDPSTLRMTEADTSSSVHSTDEGLHPTEALCRLNNPAKFLPYFAQMHSDGYEIVSGSGDILVFRKVREAGDYNNGFLQDDGNRASSYLRGEDNYDHASLTQPMSAVRGSGESQDTTSNDKSPNTPTGADKQPSHADEAPKARSRIGQTLRRMFISGAATAGACYAIGVVSEFFRTGGQDGRGIDAFTEFESERHERERG